MNHGWGKASKKQADPGQIDEGLTDGGPTLIVFTQSAREGEPGDGALNHPTAREDLEARAESQIREHLWCIALHLSPAMSPGIDHLQANAQLLTAPVPERSRIALVRPDMAEPRKRRAERAQDELGAEPVMQVGQMDYHLEQ